jgi:O-antigen ligase
MSFLVVLALIAGLPVVPRRWRIAAILPSSILQIYPPGLGLGDSPVSLVFVLSCSFWPDAIREARSIINFRPTLALLGLVLVTILSFSWSVDLHLALAALSNLLGFLIVYAGFTAQSRRGAEWIVRGTRLMALAALFLAFSVVAFRLLPLVKMGFLQSPLGSIFINANVLNELFLDGKNNVFDPLKSGGFGFVNANVASTELGMLAMMLFGVSRAYGDRLLLISSIVLIGVIPFTGSKAGIMLIGAMCGLLYLLYLFRKGGVAQGFLAISGGLVILLLLGLLGPIETRSSAAGFGSEVQGTTDTRFLIWEFAVSSLAKSPLLGQGFGGWQATFPAYARQVGLSPNFPPHNTFLYLWSQSGILAMLLGLCFAVAVLKRAFAQIRHVDDECRGLALALGMGFLWLTSQGLGENLGLLGETHMAPVLAAMMALFRARLVAFDAKTDRNNA